MFFTVFSAQLRETLRGSLASKRNALFIDHMAAPLAIGLVVLFSYMNASSIDAIFDVFNGDQLTGISVMYYTLSVALLYASSLLTKPRSSLYTTLPVSPGALGIMDVLTSMFGTQVGLYSWSMLLSGLLYFRPSVGVGMVGVVGFASANLVLSSAAFFAARVAQRSMGHRVLVHAVFLGLLVAVPTVAYLDALPAWGLTALSTLPAVTAVLAMADPTPLHLWAVLPLPVVAVLGLLVVYWAPERIVRQTRSRLGERLWGWAPALVAREVVLTLRVPERQAGIGFVLFALPFLAVDRWFTGTLNDADAAGIGCAFSGLLIAEHFVSEARDEAWVRDSSLLAVPPAALQTARRLVWSITGSIVGAGVAALLGAPPLLALSSALMFSYVVGWVVNGLIKDARPSWRRSVVVRLLPFAFAVTITFAFHGDALWSAVLFVPFGVLVFADRGKALMTKLAVVDDSVSVTDLTMNFLGSSGVTQALAEVTLTLPPGKLTALVGANGAGKTTLLRILAGLQVPTQGLVRVLGFSPARDRVRLLHHAGLVLDNPTFHEHLTVAEVFAFVAKVHGIEPSVAEMRWQALAPVLEIDGCRDLHTGSLSFGQRKRFALACALVHNPRLLLLDEPLTGLDPRGVDAVLRVLHERTEDGCTVLLSTHQLEVAEQADHVVWIERGQVRAQGTPAALTNGKGTLRSQFVDG